MLICEHNFLMVEVGVGGEVIGVVRCFSFFVLGVKCGDCIIIIAVACVALVAAARYGGESRLDHGQQEKGRDDEDDDMPAVTAWDDE